MCCFSQIFDAKTLADYKSCDIYSLGALALVMLGIDVRTESYNKNMEIYKICKKLKANKIDKSKPKLYELLIAMLSTEPPTSSSVVQKLKEV